MVDSPREIVGAVLKYMGASYNTTNIDSQVVGGKHAVLQQLELLVQQVRQIIVSFYGKINTCKLFKKTPCMMKEKHDMEVVGHNVVHQLHELYSI